MNLQNSGQLQNLPKDVNKIIFIIFIVKIFIIKKV